MEEARVDYGVTYIEYTLLFLKNEEQIFYHVNLLPQWGHKGGGISIDSLKNILQLKKKSNLQIYSQEIIFINWSYCVLQYEFPVRQWFCISN